MSGDQIDWGGLRAAAVAIGIRKAAREAARDLPPDERERFVQRAMKRSSREKWLVKARQNRADAAATSPAALSANVRSGADAIATTLAERREKSALHLSRYVVDASQKLASSKGELKLARSGKDVVAMRSGIWPEHQNKTEIGLTLNLLNITSGNS